MSEYEALRGEGWLAMQYFPLFGGETASEMQIWTGPKAAQKACVIPQNSPHNTERSLLYLLDH